MTQSNAVPLPEPGKPKLLDQVRHRCRLRHLALSTEHSYVAWIRRFILFHNKRHPLEMGAKEVTDFLTNLAVAGHVAASTQNQALSALLFLYREVLEKDFGWLEDVVRANKPKRLPTVFTPEEAAAIIGQLAGVRWLMGMQLYGGGCRPVPATAPAAHCVEPTQRSVPRLAASAHRHLAQLYHVRADHALDRRRKSP